MSWARVRLGALLIILMVLLGWQLSLHWGRVVPWPVYCDEQPPYWLPALTKLIRQLGYPGYQLAIRNPAGEAINCAAGWAAPGPTLVPLTNEHRLRYASLSKVFTSIVATQLIAEEKLDTGRPLLGYLAPQITPLDRRLQDITLGQLLRHTAGFDRNVTADPMMQVLPWCPRQLKTLENLMLDHDPGSRYAYSNLGYCLLGAVIERVEGLSLGEVFQKRIFFSAGASSIIMAETGGFSAGEPGYSFEQPDTHSSLRDLSYRDMAATGAWIGTGSDFVRVLAKAFNNSDALLDADSQASLLAVDSACDVSRWRTCHGNGFYRYQSQPDALSMYWRDGSLPGVSSFAGLMGDGTTFVFLANGRRYDWLEANDRIGQLLYKHLNEE